jgi:hypothetical protein
VEEKILLDLMRSDTMNNDELAHFGVLGMHWGQRRGTDPTKNPNGANKEQIKKWEQQAKPMHWSTAGKVALGFSIAGALMTPLFLSVPAVGVVAAVAGVQEHRRKVAQTALSKISETKLASIR